MIRPARHLVLALLSVGSLICAGCGSTAVNNAVTTSARQAAQAACLQASASIKDQTARANAEQACRAVGSGDKNQLTLAAKQAAREACLQGSQQISDPTAKAAAKASCPPGK